MAVREAGRIPGGQLLDLIRDRWFGRYARFPSSAALDAVTLWAADCHMRDDERHAGDRGEAAFVPAELRARVG